MRIEERAHSAYVSTAPQLDARASQSTTSQHLQRSRTRLHTRSSKSSSRRPQDLRPAPHSKTTSLATARHPQLNRSTASQAPHAPPIMTTPGAARPVAGTGATRPPPAAHLVYFAGPPAAAAASPPAACLRYFSISSARGLARSPRVTLERGRTVLRCTAHDTQ